MAAGTCKAAILALEDCDAIESCVHAIGTSVQFRDVKIARMIQFGHAWKSIARARPNSPASTKDNRRCIRTKRNVALQDELPWISLWPSPALRPSRTGDPLACRTVAKRAVLRGADLLRLSCRPPLAPLTCRPTHPSETLPGVVHRLKGRRGRLGRVGGGGAWRGSVYPDAHNCSARSRGCFAVARRRRLPWP